MDPVRLTLIGKPGCHLCDDARGVIETVRGELASLPGKKRIDTELIELNILEDEQLALLHSEHIPVVLIGDRRHAIWQVDREKFTAAVVKAARASKPSMLQRLKR